MDVVIILSVGIHINSSRNNKDVISCFTYRDKYDKICHNEIPI